MKRSLLSIFIWGLLFQYVPLASASIEGGTSGIPGISRPNKEGILFIDYKSYMLGNIPDPYFYAQNGDFYFFLNTLNEEQIIIKNGNIVFTGGFGINKIISSDDKKNVAIDIFVKKEIRYGKRKYSLRIQ